MTSKIWPMLALMLAAPSLAGAQDPGRGPPRPDFAALQRREADDMALLLGLRPEQRPALAAYLQMFVPPPPPNEGPPPRDAQTPGDSFAQQLQRMTDMAARRSADDTRRIAAARTFYDGLMPPQRAAFEALMRLRHGPPIMMGPAMLGGMPGGPMPGGPMHGRPISGAPDGPFAR